MGKFGEQHLGPPYSTKHLFFFFFFFFFFFSSYCVGATTEKFLPFLVPAKKLLPREARSKHGSCGLRAAIELVRPNVQSENNAMEVGGGMGGTCTDTFFEYSLVSLEHGLAMTFSWSRAPVSHVWF
jgi:hypothetical protein